MSSTPFDVEVLKELREDTTNYAKEPGELLWKNKLFFRVAEKGRAAATVDAMAGDPLAKKHAPRFLLATDGEEVYCRDVKADQTRDIIIALRVRLYRCRWYD